MDTGIRILAVDDDESIRNVLDMVLTGDGHTVTTASSAEEALDLFIKDPHPLVISDVRLEGMSGLQLLSMIKKSHPDTHVIIITSYASLEIAIQALRSGAYDFIVKPFEDIDIISAAVNRASEKIMLFEENRRLIEALREKNDKLTISNQILEELSVRDGLTGLHNHRYFQDFLYNECQRCLRYKRVFSIIFMDVDNFKKYNDTHGHPAGDKLLMEFGKIISPRLRKTDLFARYGGEEFVIVLPDTSKESAILAAEDIRKAIEEHHFYGQETQPSGTVTASIGVASFPEDGNDSRSILHKADQALYTAKHTGKNRVYYFSSAEVA